MADYGQPLEVRSFAGLRFWYRPGSVDEQVLEEQYAAPRFFAARYQPRESDVIVDAGAHIGPFAIQAARLVPRGVVHAVEPAADSFAILQANVALNEITHARTHRLALSGTSGTVRLYHAPESWGHALAGPWAASGAPFEEVQAQTLGEFFDRHGIDVVDYLKMNIEGAEYEVFRQAPAAILRRIGCMLVEMHPADDRIVWDLLGRLAAAGFATDVVLSDNPAVKGWLTAYRPDR